MSDSPHLWAKFPENQFAIKWTARRESCLWDKFIKESLMPLQQHNYTHIWEMCNECKRKIDFKGSDFTRWWLFCNFFNIQRRQLFHLMCILIECHFLGSSPIDSIKSFNFFPFIKFSPKELTIFTRRWIFFTLNSPF